ncbi:hypothetical protein SynPROSU1_02068 [Synechococcus sp. PROS-U-1]|nr:hypothetical protein SynPROSU1_02068 [Synechococcus sp. PROS-U-1]
MTQVINWSRDSGDGVYIGWGHNPNEPKHISHRTMTFETTTHTLTGAKFVSFLQQLFGAKQGVYDADAIRKMHGTREPNNGDTLIIDEKQDINGTITWDMGSGDFSQTQEFRGTRHTDEMNIINFENLDASEADRIDFTIKGTNGDNEITTSDGRDEIDAGQGLNTISTGKGRDTVTGGIGVDVVNGGDHSDTFITQVGRGLMFIEDFTQGEDKLLMVEGVTDGIDPVIKDYRDAWEDIRDHLQRAGLDPWEAEGIYHDAIDDFSNASVVYKDGDLVAVIDGVSANELSIDTRRNAIV